MKHSYTTTSYIDFSAKIDQACDWLENLGISYSRTRIGAYKSLFSTLSKHQSANTLDEFYEIYSFPEWVNAAHECAELIRTYEGLADQNDPNLTSRLKMGIKGHEIFVLDNKERSGRDFSFEMSVAAKFCQQGYFVDFGHDADIMVTFNNETLFLECKRLKSQKNVRGNIKKGLKQLHNRYKYSTNPGGARGLLVLSIGKVTNPSFGLLEGKDAVDLGNKAFAYNAAFIDKHNRLWIGTKDKRTLGAVVIFDLPGILKQNKQLTTCHEVTLNNSVPSNTPDHDLLLRVAHEVFAARC